MLSKDDGLAARLSRASFLRLLQELREYGQRDIPVQWSGCGVLQMAKEPKEERLFEEILQQHRYPEQYVQFFSKAQASRALGQEAAAGGLFFPEGGWVNPPSLCRARLEAFASIQPKWGCRAAQIEAGTGAWQVLGDDGQLLGEAPVVIVANAWEAAHFSQTAFLPFKKVRGQVTHIPEGVLPAPPHVLSRDGYLTPAQEGFSSLGATYDFQRVDLAPDDESHRRNWARLPELLPAQDTLTPLKTLTGRVGIRTLTPDRMPIVGAVPERIEAHGASPGGCERIPGLYCALGLGSRGLVWSTLMGEFLAASLCGEPSPLTVDLAAAVDPARFVGAGRRQALR
jgi:tRNA 5-methylaminomethyl-2-thiouridine biosynthesis bifunctional protein